MPLANCPRCKKMFSKMSFPVCPQCEPAEEEDYNKVRSLLDEQPNVSMEAAAELTGVDISVVNRMLSQGLITNVEFDGKVTCGNCGAPAISLSKRLCQACLDAMNLKVAEAQRKLSASIPPPPKIQSKLNVRRKLDER